MQPLSGSRSTPRPGASGGTGSSPKARPGSKIARAALTVHRTAHLGRVSTCSLRDVQPEASHLRCVRVLLGPDRREEAACVAVAPLVLSEHPGLQRCFESFDRGDETLEVLPRVVHRSSPSPASERLVAPDPTRGLGHRKVGSRPPTVTGPRRTAPVPTAAPSPSARRNGPRHALRSGDLPGSRRFRGPKEASRRPQASG